ncbi:MAG: DUF2254 domain-containing protein [Alphaproteobacteria bacterium]
MIKTFLSTLWEKLSTSYWFLPTVLALCAIGLSALTLRLDQSVNTQWARHATWVWAGGPEGARNVLATIASSTITVAGVVFSITIVTLTLASSQFGPRLLRNFMNDWGTQTVLGAFVATFLYCLLVLRAIRGTDDLTVVPFLSVTCGVIFALVSVGFLIFFIHHISTSIIAENVIARVACELQHQIDSLYPEKAGRASDDDQKRELPEEFLRRPGLIHSHRSGFIQAIAIQGLLELAKKRDLIIRLRRRPGEFLAESELLAEVMPAARLDDELCDQIRGTVFFGKQRTPTQDIEYSIDQLVEVAVRALSPGVNDPFTTITCIEWLGDALIRVARREIPSPWRCDSKGELRVVTDATDFAGIARAALSQIRQYGTRSVAVTIRLLEVLARVGPHLVRQNDRRILLDHAQWIRDDGVAKAENANDQQEIDQRYRTAMAALHGMQDQAG